jgi:cytochrome P450
MAFLQWMFENYGDFTYIRLAWVRMYFVNRPGLIREVLTVKMKSFRRLPKQMNALRRIEGDGLVVSEGETWSRHRPVVQGIFHQRYLSHHAGVYVGYTQRRMAEWKPETPFDLAEEMNQLALQIIAKLIFDVEMFDEASRLRREMHIFREAMQAELSSPLYKLYFIRRRRQGRAIAEVNALLWRFIREHRTAMAAGEPKHDMLGMILKMADAMTSSPKLSDEEIRDEIATLFVAGHDTTSAALAWFWYVLAKHPEVEAKAIAEVDAVLGDRPATYDDAGKLDYLERVVKESMRLYPAAAFLFGRQAIEDVELGGHTLRRGAWVMMSPFVVHRNPANFADPLTFDPDRFTKQREKEIAPYSYIPFGGGSRICIGNSLAMTEILLLAATVLQKFRIVFAEPPRAEVDLRVEVVLRPVGELMMKAVPRAGKS